MKDKITIYQVLPRLFGNRNRVLKEFGTIAENGCGKFDCFSESVLKRIHNMGFTHVWYTGVIRHATQTDYSSHGIPTQHSEVVKGRAGSPYAITDYYDVDPDLAQNVDNRMAEWESLVGRTHDVGMKVIMDFVPNHVAREYKSICKPDGVRDLGEDDNVKMNFSANNNFYYCWGQKLDLSDITGDCKYIENPAKATGNDKFTSKPGVNDWYETIKLNYGIDYCDAGGRSGHFSPIPNTWVKMTDILLFWASKGVDGFRCDMAEMVPVEFWKYATVTLKKKYPDIIFIGEVYDINQYRCYIDNGFDYLYDKVGMYDCLRSIVRDERPASAITYEWQNTDDIHDHMLYFLENHDEQRIASDFYAGDGYKAIPAAIVSILMRSNPFMLYSGQEFGEKGMDKEGFSGRDGRTSIFDYWAPDTLSRGYSDRRLMTEAEKLLAISYRHLLLIANNEDAVREGDFFDLMYVNPGRPTFNTRREFAFIRCKDDTVILVVANFSSQEMLTDVVVPSHAFDFCKIPERKVMMNDLLSGESILVDLKRDGVVSMKVPAYGGRVYKFSTKMNDNGYIFNEHNKDEFPPAHTAEHLLNQLMIRMFGCERSRNAHIERKKSKISYVLDHKPSRQEERDIERGMNDLIQEDLDVNFEFVDRDHIPDDVKIDRLPENASELLRIVRIGDYDACPCIGKHVRSTSQIGRFELLGTNWDEMTHTFRIRFKVVQ
jgi:glycosidase